LVNISNQSTRGGEGERGLVFNVTFSNISVISWWRSVLLVEETGVPEENHHPAVSS